MFVRGLWPAKPGLAASPQHLRLNYAGVRASSGLRGGSAIRGWGEGAGPPRAAVAVGPTHLGVHSGPWGLGGFGKGGFLPPAAVPDLTQTPASEPRAGAEKLPTEPHAFEACLSYAFLKVGGNVV